MLMIQNEKQNISSVKGVQTYSRLKETADLHFRLPVHSQMLSEELIGHQTIHTTIWNTTRSTWKQINNLDFVNWPARPGNRLINGTLLIDLLDQETD